MKTNYSDLTKRYELAYKQLWSSYPLWKKTIITESPDSHISSEFAQAVMELAENPNTKFKEDNNNNKNKFVETVKNEEVVPNSENN